jgi:hypothetical protein
MWSVRRRDRRRRSMKKIMTRGGKNVEEYADEGEV